ncbi:hypothetical protein [Streptomyces sp. GC420]|uniref:hypothetical protein n=1 Tax=Streptomyces sp. GC420 TaxID=2697568 RepID=UPI0014152959|nr:hypothetical protein [Streptomyces sp. GC420]NBM16182.1 hypothetical protein [Streptomyces sp. GC420]
MLSNRNLDWTGAARTFLHLTGRYWSASTYGMVGHGHTGLTPGLLAGFTTVLGIPADDLAALTGPTVPMPRRGTRRRPTRPSSPGTPDA